MKVDSTITKEVTAFLNEYYENQYASLISGSHVDGNNNEYSDIDVCVFTKDRNTVFNETFPYKDLKIQAIIIPIQLLQQAFWEDYATGRGSFIGMIAKGEILFDTSNFLKHLISHTKKIQAMGGRPLSEKEIYSTRVQITSHLFDFMGGDDIYEYVFSINNILDLVSIFKLRISGNWAGTGSGKHRMKFLKKSHPVFHSKLISSVKEIYAKENKVPFVNLIKDCLEEYGGLIPYYSKSNLLSNISTNYLIIQINTTELNKNLMKHTAKKLAEFIDTITVKKIEYYFFSSRAINVRKTEENVYMVIDAEKDFINDYLIDRINFFVNGKTGFSKLLFPSKLDPRHRFSNDKIYHFIAPVFYKTSKLVLEQNNSIFNQNFQVKFSLSLLKEIKLDWFKNDVVEFLAFLDYLIACWLVFSYDDGSTIMTSQLLKKKEEILEKFEAMYLEQKEELKKIYCSKNDGEKEFLQMVNQIPKVPNLKDVPAYKTYLLDKNDLKAKRWSFYKEVVFKIFSIAFVDNRFMTYIPFVAKKIELND